MGADSDTAGDDDVPGDDACMSDDAVCEMAVGRDDVEPWPASPMVDWTSGLLSKHPVAPVYTNDHFRNHAVSMTSNTEIGFGPKQLFAGKENAS